VGTSVDVGDDKVGNIMVIALTYASYTHGRTLLKPSVSSLSEGLPLFSTYALMGKYSWYLATDAIG